MSTEYPDEFLDILENVTRNVSEVLEVSTISSKELSKNLAEMDLMEKMETTTASVSLEELKISVDTFFVLINSFVIFFLQAGFAFLEAGSVRSKNTTNILFKNILDCLLGAVSFWICGYMIATSNGNAFMGLDVSYMCLAGTDNSHFAPWLFGFVFCATAATIVSGAVAERCELAACLVYSFVISGLVYPVVFHWAWTEEGWLAVNGYHDWAGAGVVHHLGGVCALMGAVFLGPRIGRFDRQGKVRSLPGHSVALTALGAFILMFGFLSFVAANNGAVASQEDRDIVQRAVVNTIIGGVSAGLTVLLATKLMEPAKKWSLLVTINGILCGMIATCASNNEAETWATFLLGVVGGLAYILVHHTMLWFKVDDPLDAVAVHSGGGVVGVLAAPFVIGEGGVFSAVDSVTAMHQIWSQVVGLLVITAWSAATTGILFFFLKLNNKLRLPREAELDGCDITKHGEDAYPAEAYTKDNIEEDNEAAELPPKDPVHAMAREDKEPEWESVKMKTLVMEGGSMPVTPLKFRKISQDDDNGSTVSSQSSNEEKILTGIDNEAMEDNEENQNKTYQETHFDEETEEKHKTPDRSRGPMKLVISQDRAIDFNNSRESHMI